MEETEETILECNNCGKRFPPEDLEEIEEKGCYESDYGVYDQFDSHTYYNYTYLGCPHCGSEDYSEVLDE